MKRYLKQHLLVAAALFMILSGCKKELSTEVHGNTITNTSNVNKVKKYSERFSSPGFDTYSAFNLSYDAMNRLLLMADSATPADRFAYAYLTGKYTMDLYTTGAPTLHETFFLNSSSLVDSTFQYESDTTTEKYIYNGSNRVVKEKEYDYTAAGGSVLTYSVDNTYDASGNLTQSVDSDGTTTTYQYYPNLDLIYMGMIYRPVTSKNLVKKMIVDDGSSLETINTTYTFDSQNRVTASMSVSDAGYTLERRYTYFN